MSFHALLLPMSVLAVLLLAASPVDTWMGVEAGELLRLDTCTSRAKIILLIIAKQRLVKT